MESGIKMKYKVSVDKSMYCTGSVEVDSTSADKAGELVEAMINSGKLQTTEVDWGDLTYEDMSFKTTGDVENGDNFLDNDDVIKNISNALESLSGNEIASVYNEICDKKITYKGDSVWHMDSQET